VAGHLVKAASFASVDLNPAWSSGRISSGTFLQRMVTSVPSGTAARVHVIVIAPANAGSSDSVRVEHRRVGNSRERHGSGDKRHTRAFNIGLSILNLP
jgi:hypothetical protein